MNDCSFQPVEPLTIFESSEDHFIDGPLIVNLHDRGFFTVVQYDEQTINTASIDEKPPIFQVVATLQRIESGEHIRVVWRAKSREILNDKLMSVGKLPELGCIVRLGAREFYGVYQPKLCPTTIWDYLSHLVEKETP